MLRVHIIAPSGNTILDLRTEDEQAARLAFESYSGKTGALLRLERDGRPLLTRRLPLVARARKADDSRRLVAEAGQAIGQELARRLKPLELAEFCLQVEKMEALWPTLTGKARQKARSSARNMRRAYQLALAEMQASGNRLRRGDVSGEPILNPTFRRFRK